MVNHLQSTSGCKYEEVKCPNGKCTEKMMRVNYEAHVENQCVYRMYKCRFCEYKDTFWAIMIGDGGSPSHYTQCAYYPLTCPNKCGATAILRKDLQSHRKDCPLEKTPCPYVGTGCEKHSLLRKDLVAHLEKDIHHHMLGLLKSHVELKRKCGK